MDLFGKDQVKILIFEEFVQNTREAVGDILHFLGINFNDLPDNLEIAYNAFSVPRFRYLPRIISLMANVRNKAIGTESKINFGKLQSGSPTSKRSIIRKLLSKNSSKPKIPEHGKLFLKSLYLEDVIKLQVILGRSVPWLAAKE